MNKSLSRRSFLKTGGVVLGAGLATCCGLTALAGRAPEPSLSLAEWHYGDVQMSSKVLLTYASRCGSTMDVAQSIAQTISQSGPSVDVLPVKNITSADVLQTYQAVVIGSAIRRGMWLPEASNFVKQNQDVLTKLPLAYFTVCMTLSSDTPENRQRAAAFLDPVHTVLKPQAEAFFAGKYDPTRVSPIDRLMCQMFGTTEGDFRDWRMIEDWSIQTASQLVVGSES